MLVVVVTADTVGSVVEEPSTSTIPEVPRDTVKEPVV